MKILLIGFTKIKYMPYMKFYLDNINLDRNELHLLYWNRDLKKEDTTFLSRIMLHEFKMYQEDDVPKLTKLGNFMKFREYAIRIIYKENYDFIIFLHSIPGILLADVFKSDFKNKFIFDYRDSTYEFFLPFKKIVEMLVKESYATFVSSNAFRRFLPTSESRKIFTSHNILVDSFNHRDDKMKYGILSNRIRISFWGFIRDEKINRILINKISKDNRFELHYYGREQKIAHSLKEHVRKNQICNVFFHGEYKPTDRYKFILETDLIHNIYNDKNTMLALGNKYYDGIIFRIPQICMKGSYMAKMVSNAGIGFTVNPSDLSFLDDLFDSFYQIDRREFNKRCDIECERVMCEFQNGIKLLKEKLG